MTEKEILTARISGHLSDQAAIDALVGLGSTRESAEDLLRLQDSLYEPDIEDDGTNPEIHTEI